MKETGQYVEAEHSRFKIGRDKNVYHLHLAAGSYFALRTRQAISL
jgi:hypothetical protein